MRFKSVSAVKVQSSANVLHEVEVPKNASLNEMIALFDHFAQFCAFEMGVSVEDIQDRIKSAEGKFFFEMESDLDNTSNPFFSQNEITID